MLTVSNRGPGPATGVTLTITPPAGSAFLGVLPTQGSCSGTGPITCQLSTIEAGAAASVLHTVRLTGAGISTNRVSVGANEPDPTPGDNTGAQTVPVGAPLLPPLPLAVDPPDPGEFNIEPVSGTVLVRLPGTNIFVPLSEVSQVPSGTLIDVTNGRITIVTAADEQGVAGSAQFYGGIFTLVQESVVGSVTVLQLSGGDYNVCPPGLRRRAIRRPAGVESHPGHPVRRLWGSGRGRFRTRGRYSSATVRGTIWLTEDRCNGTFTRVTEGSVVVFDLVRRANVVVDRRRPTYLARAGR
jgi:hypothetical protein